MKIREVDDNVIQGPWKKKEEEPKRIKIPLHRAFGGPEYADLVDAGVGFIEKPGSFSYVDRGGSDGDRFVHIKDLKGIEQMIGRKLESYNAYDILDFRPIKTPRGHIRGWYDNPEVDADFSKLKQNEETFILWFPSGETELEKWHTARNRISDVPQNKRYLVNRTGGKKYVRMWVALVD